jgi:endonuclease YncB( thermonuclease family)
MKAIVFFFLVWTVTESVGQTTLIGKVINVIDGNTVEVTTVDKPQRLVFVGIDCPDMGQEYADKAKKFTEKLLLDEQVTYQITGKDRWGNYLAIIMKGDKDPRVELLQEGLAWTSEKNPLPELEEHRVRAFEKGRGLWKDENPTPPWIFRRQQSMMQAKSN